MALRPKVEMPNHSCWAAVTGISCSKALSDNCSTDFSCSGCIVTQIGSMACITHHARHVPCAADKVWQAITPGVPHTQRTCSLPLQPSSDGLYPALSARLTDIRRSMMRAPKVLSSWVTYR